MDMHNQYKGVMKRFTYAGKFAVLILSSTILTLTPLARANTDPLVTKEVSDILTQAIEPGVFVEDVPTFKMHFKEKTPKNGFFADTVVVPGTNLSDMILDRLKVNEAITPETTALFGETIDPNTGVFSMQHIDVNIPGNSKLPVELRRIFRGARYAYNSSLSLGDWQLGIPSYSTTIIQDPFNHTYSGAWGKGKLCSGELNPDQIGVGPNSILNPGDYWSGDTLDIPGVETAKVLYKQATGINKYVNNWKLTCYTVSSDPMERIKATSPEGITYHFGQPKLIPTQPISASNGVGLDEVVSRYNAFMLVTKISDRFGNEVNFTYSDGQLTQISSNDGRAITLTYEKNPYGKYRVKTVSANGQTWQYAYINANHAVKADQLVRVTRPDGRSWQFTLDKVNRGSAGSVTDREYFYQYDYTPDGIVTRLLRIEESQCLDISYNPLQSASVIHPNGAKLDLGFKTIRFGRSEVPKVKAHNVYDVHANDLCFLSNSIVSKSISQAGLSPLNWSYSYSQNKGKWAGVTGGQALTGLYQTPTGYNAMDLRSTTINNPDGSKTVHVFSRKWDYTDGQEVATEYYDNDGSTLLQRKERSFTNVSTGASPDYYSYTGPEHAWSFLFDNPAPHANYVNKTKEVTYNYENGLYDSYTLVYSNFNAYGAPGKITEYNSLGNQQRHTLQTYTHDTTNWLLNLPASKALSTNGSTYTTVEQTNYYAPNHTYKSLPYQTYKFGQLESTFASYHPDGNLKQQNLNAPNRWIYFENYKRGKPQVIKVPQRYTASCTNPATCYMSASLNINNDGTVAQVVDLNGNQTNYMYDNMSRLTKVTPKDTKWAATSISYTTENGLFTRTESKGNFRSKTNYDGLLRPILTQEWDATVAGSNRYLKQSFNAYNKTTFKSYFSSNSNETKGIATRYDGLQRVTRTFNTVNNTGTDYHYQAGNEIQMTDAKGNSTFTTYHAWGTPEHSLPSKIESPENITTTISYNVFNNPTSISQGSVNEIRTYNAQQRLCRSSRPDVGSTAYNYNAIGELIWEAKGASGSTSVCDEGAVLGTQKVTYSYDNLGKVRTMAFGDGTPTRTFTLDKQGNLNQLVAGTATWSYNYNSKHLLETELLKIDTKSLNLKWTYNNLGHIDSLTYPTGRVVSFNPNALGQARQAGSFASSVSYYPDSKINQFNYGNGIVRKYQLDALNRPQTLRDYYATTNYVDFTHGYDNNDNIISVTDSVDTQYNLTLSYDSANRLKSANGKWGAGSFVYDTVGNITKQQLGNFVLNYAYANNRLASVSGSQTRNFSYDARGNVTNNGLRGFNFNLANQLVSSATLSYVYDGHDRLVKRNYNGAISYPMYSQTGKLLHEVNSDGSSTDYVYLSASLIAKVKGNATSYVHADLLGSPRLETDTNRAVVSNSRQHYQPYGNRIPTSNFTDIGFTGHKHDGELGLTYMQARYYDPVIGRFYSNDPVDAMGHLNTPNGIHGFNRYTYGNNNPFKYTDPTGKSSYNPQRMAVEMARTQGEAKAIHASYTTPRSGSDTTKIVAGAALSLTGNIVAGAITMGEGLTGESLVEQAALALDIEPETASNLALGADLLGGMKGVAESIKKIGDNFGPATINKMQEGAVEATAQGAVLGNDIDKSIEETK
ncbi:RHS repeat domain-containing protein [Pseudoalteromonas fenneropenaei]|uniref:RHS repeat domain-containing protein n=1 Tax=Pseudoalteromonas fenneropenaei TaxID=1737459 RepID=A0ABV7CJI7_9GAMM